MAPSALVRWGGSHGLGRTCTPAGGLMGAVIGVILVQALVARHREDQLETLAKDVSLVWRFFLDASGVED